LVDSENKNQEMLDELTALKNQLIALPSKFGIGDGLSIKNFDYQAGKLRFDSWLMRFTYWMSQNVPGSENEIDELKYRYDDANCRPSGSGYGTKSQMVKTVFIKPFINKIETLREDIESGDFEMLYKKQVGNSYSGAPYVSHQRIEELDKITCEFDFSKLIAMLKELNVAHQHELFYSVGCLLRAILDHVPPVFCFKNFNEVANNYQGTKSFKEAMKGLNDQMRKITDSYLHTQIRNKEVLPVKQQVEARNSLDLMLSEIIRIV